jgi:hypothetical protein
MRSIYFQWPIAEREMITLGLIDKMVIALPTYTKSEYIRDVLLNVDDFIHDVRGKVMLRNLAPLTTNGLFDTLTATEDRMNALAATDPVIDAFKSEV